MKKSYEVVLHCFEEGMPKAFAQDIEEVIVRIKATDAMEASKKAGGVVNKKYSYDVVSASPIAKVSF